MKPAFPFRNTNSLHNSLIFFARESRNGANSRLICALRRNRGESLFNPCLSRKFADSGQKLKNHVVNREKSLINSLVQGIDRGMAAEMLTSAFSAERTRLLLMAVTVSNAILYW